MRTHQPSIDTLIEMSNIFNVSVDYIVGKTDIKLPADRFLTEGLTENEIELLNIFRDLDKNNQQKAIGILFALKNYDISYNVQQSS